MNTDKTLVSCKYKFKRKDLVLVYKETETGSSVFNEKYLKEATRRLNDLRGLRNTIFNNQQGN